MQATPQDVKRAFILGNLLKADWKDFKLFEQQLIQHSGRLATLTENELDDLIHDKRRLNAYQLGKWELGIVDLDQCRVYEYMGGKKYMHGTLPEACLAYEQQGSECTKLNNMTSMASNGFFSRLPIIVFRKSSSDGFRIDDGNHRAVSSYLAGIRQVECYIGTVPSRYNHSW